MAKTLTYTVAGLSCAHCKAAVESELLATPRVTEADVDLDTKQVVVQGTDLDDSALRAAILEAGYEAS
jgi:copper chaperone